MREQGRLRGRRFSRSRDWIFCVEDFLLGTPGRGARAASKSDNGSELDDDGDGLWGLGSGCYAAGGDGCGAGLPAAQSPAAAKVGGTIRGTVKAGAVPLPGVGVTATNTLTGKKYATTTDVTGAYAMSIPSNGRYVVKAEMVAFASETKEVVVNAAGLNGGKADQTAEFGLQLASRVTQPASSGAGGSGSGGGGALAGRSGGGTARAAGRGMQALSMTSSDTDLLDASAGGGNTGVQMPTLSGVDGGTDSSPGVATDSVAVSGVMGQTNGLGGLNEDDIRQRVQDTIAQAQRQGGNQNDVINAVVGVLGGYMNSGAFGGPGGGGPGGGGGGGGRGGRGGGGGGGGGGAFRGFDPTQVHGAFAYTGANSALNANSFSVTGHPLPKPDSSTNTFIGSLTGSPYIPGLTKPNPKQFVFISGQLSRKTTPTIQQLIVPTMAQRGGDFSTLGQPIYAPSAGLSAACLSAGVDAGPAFSGESDSGELHQQFGAGVAELLSAAERCADWNAGQLPDEYDGDVALGSDFGAVQPQLRAGTGAGWARWIWRRGIWGRAAAAEPEPSQGAAAEHCGELCVFAYGGEFAELVSVAGRQYCDEWIQFSELVYGGLWAAEQHGDAGVEPFEQRGIELLYEHGGKPGAGGGGERGQSDDL